MNTLEQDKTIEKVKQMRTDGVSGSNDLYERMVTSDNFRTGKQWDPAIKESIDNRGKFALTVPLIKPQIKQIAGTEIANPRQIKVFNTKDGTSTIAKLLTALAKQVSDTEKLQYEQSDAFEEGIAIGQTALIATKDRNEDPKHANIKIEKAVGHEMLFDPNCIKYNINHREGGCKYIIWEPWVDKDLVKAEYPSKKKDLEAMGNPTQGEGIVMGAVNSIIDWLTGRRLESTTTFTQSNRTDTHVLSKSRFQVNHTWWREPKKCIWWYDERENELDAKLITDDKEMAAVRKAAKENPEVFSVEEVVCNVMHHTIRVGDIFLEDRVNEWNTPLYPIFPYWPYFENGNKGSLTEDLKGTQEEINWTHSQALNMVKSLANTGLVIEGDASGEYKDWLEANAGLDNVVMEKDKAGGSIEKIEQNEFPVAMTIIEQNAHDNIKKISGIRTEDPTTDKDRVASAIRLKQQNSLTGSATVFRNWDWTLSMKSDFVIEVIRNNDIFSEDEIREIVDQEDLIDKDIIQDANQLVTQQFKDAGMESVPPEEIDPVALQNADPATQQRLIEQAREDLELFNAVQQKILEQATPIAEAILIDSIHNMKRGKYSTKISLSPLSETMRAIKSVELFGLHEVLINGGDVGLDGEDLIDGTEIDNKEGVKEGRRRKLQSIQQSDANVSLSRTA